MSNFCVKFDTERVKSDTKCVKSNTENTEKSPINRQITEISGIYAWSR
jgi:hypothetical protein